jgi:hypothetical protein
MHYESPIREPLITGNKSYHDITEEVARPIETTAGRSWWIVFGISAAMFLWGMGCLAYTVGTGIGVWGSEPNHRLGLGHHQLCLVGWYWTRRNLDFCRILLFRQKWRMSINRSAEAMTIFAVVQAGLFPVFHMGRVWNAYWVLPIPNNFGSLWVNFNSPLLWDVFAISTYLSISLVFWYMGLIPDFAMIRDRAVKPMQKKIYTVLSFGWGGKAKHWQRFEELSLVLLDWQHLSYFRYTPLYPLTLPLLLFQDGTPRFSLLTL